MFKGQPKYGRGKAVIFNKADLVHTGKVRATNRQSPTCYKDFVPASACQRYPAVNNRPFPTVTVQQDYSGAYPRPPGSGKMFIYI